MIDPGSPPTPADSGLRCQTCEYNLTGMAENRCPECGEPFDPEKLQAILDGAPGPIPIWDDTTRNVIWRFILICLLTWFVPWRLAQKFPRRYRRRSAMKFRWLTLLVALCTAVVLLSLSLARIPAVTLGKVWVCLSFFLCIWAGVGLCETILGGMLIASLAPEEDRQPCPDPQADYSWAGLVGFFRTFTILSVAAACLCLRWYDFRAISALAPNGTPPLVAVCVVLWWWAALSMAIILQPASLMARIVCILLIPFVAAFSAFVAIIVGLVLLLPMEV